MFDFRSYRLRCVFQTINVCVEDLLRIYDTLKMLKLTEAI